MKGERLYSRHGLRPAVVTVLLLLLCDSDADTTKQPGETASSSIPTMSMSSISPTPTSSLSSVRPTSSLPVPPPRPTPKPNTPLILYNNGSALYLRIEEIFIRFNDHRYPEVNRSLLEDLVDLRSDLQHSSSDVIFTKYYGSAMQNFSFKFDFSTDASKDPPMWFLRSIVHTNPNVTSDQDVLFEYKNVRDDLIAPVDFAFTCDELTAIGYDSAEPKVVPILKLVNITVQAFYNGKIAKGTVSCDEQNGGNEKQTALIIGLVVGITITVAIIVITVSTFVLRWKKRSDYDLLD